MTAGIPTVTAPALGRLQAAVNDAAKRLYDAEAALHIARQTGVGPWISAAYDRLHEAVAGHTAAVGALPDRCRAVPPAHCAPRSPAAEADGAAVTTAPRPRNDFRPCGGAPSWTASPAIAGHPYQRTRIATTTTSDVIAERRSR